MAPGVKCFALESDLVQDGSKDILGLPAGFTDARQFMWSIAL